MLDGTWEPVDYIEAMLCAWVVVAFFLIMWQIAEGDPE